MIKDLNKPFCLLQIQDAGEILVLEGVASEFSRLNDIPRKKGVAPGGETFDSFSMIPFRQVEEKGYKAREAGEKILTLHVESQKTVSLKDALAQLPQETITLAGEPAFNYSDAQYEKLVKDVVELEIGDGAGANFVVPRKSRGTIRDFSSRKALSIFRNLLVRDYGSYWKFIFSDGKRMFVGSTPERHLSVNGGKVKMNPISGTFRKDKDWATPEAFKRDLKAFLTHPKEINELFMVVDEELKMMARMCQEGGLIVGPLLKEMSRLIHSEYMLVGDSHKDALELLRLSMFASTVTGSPLESACNVIYKHDPESRGYYGGAAVLLGRDDGGNDTLDSAITIRTVELEAGGQFVIGSGATLVRDSVPAEETKETTAKISAVLNSLVMAKGEPTPPRLPEAMKDESVPETLQERNQHLSSFWFFYQEKLAGNVGGELAGKRIVLIDNEDDFSYMLGHMLTQMGATVDIVRHSEFKAEQFNPDLFIVGAGPGNPGSDSDPKMLSNLKTLERFLERKTKFLSVCLGHQLLCRQLGYSLHRKKEPSQGVQKKIDLFGHPEFVGFYNTFVGLADKAVPGVTAAVAEDGKEIYALRGPHFASFQFHPESILTANGYRIVSDTVRALLI